MKVEEITTQLNKKQRIDENVLQSIASFAKDTGVLLKNGIKSLKNVINRLRQRKINKLTKQASKMATLINSSKIITDIAKIDSEFAKHKANFIKNKTITKNNVIDALTEIDLFLPKLLQTLKKVEVDSYEYKKLMWFIKKFREEQQRLITILNDITSDLEKESGLNVPKPSEIKTK